MKDSHTDICLFASHKFWPKIGVYAQTQRLQDGLIGQQLLQPSMSFQKPGLLPSVTKLTVCTCFGMMESKA